MAEREPQARSERAEGTGSEPVAPDVRDPLSGCLVQDHHAVEALIELTTALSTERDLNRLLNMILRTARLLTGAEGGRLYILDRPKRNLLLEVGQNDGVDKPREVGTAIPLTVNNERNLQNPYTHCAFMGDLLAVEDVYRFSGFDFRQVYEYDRLNRTRTRAFVATSLRDHEDQTVGVLSLFNPHSVDGCESTFRDEQRRIVTAFASQAAVAISTVRLIERNRYLISVLDNSNNLLKQENAELKARMAPRNRFSEIVGDSPGMRRVFDLMGKVLDTSVTVLVQGETGTGKELIAQALHHNSRRRDRPFITQNCAAVPESLLESELFGYRKGAFTGANEHKKGLIEAADGGTLFLDEIGDMPIGLQAKLLRVLQEQEVRPLGATEPKRVDVRVVAATHQDLMAKIQDGTFREDLYYRLAVFPIHLPPLRERKQDLPALLNTFLQDCAERYDRTVEGFAPEAMELLLLHSYPGNIRELRNLVERAILMAEDGSAILPEHLPPELREKAGHLRTDALPDGPRGLRERLGEVEASLIEKQLEVSGWNQTRAAKALAISRRSLIEKINKYGLQRPEYRELDRSSSIPAA